MGIISMIVGFIAKVIAVVFVSVIMIALIAVNVQAIKVWREEFK